MSAQSKVEAYIRAESRLSTIEKPPVNDGEGKGAYCWRLIRHCVRHATDLTKKADIRDVFIGHGIHHRKRLNHGRQVTQIVLNLKTKDYVTVDGSVVRVFKSDGRRKDIVTPVEPFNKLIHAWHVNLYVGWNHSEDKLLLMNEDFALQSTSCAAGSILAVAYNDNVGEVVTAGVGFITSWVFRYGGRYLLPRKTISDGLTIQDKLSLLVLEETASKMQRAYAACGTTVSVFNLYHGNLLCQKKDLHVRSITALLFFNPLKYLITGAKDGSIKVWDEKWHLQVVFVGHSQAVSTLALYPYGPHFISASHDHTLRVWSLESCDEVDKIETDGVIETFGTQGNSDHSCSTSGTHADLWKVQHIHTLHTSIGYAVNSMKATDHPEYPIRNVLLCKDSSVRILSPTSGDVITTLLMPSRRQLVDAAYAIAEDLLFAVFANGDIVKCDTSTNPCTVLDEWKCVDPNKTCNYLLVYEYVITAELQGDTWAAMKRAIQQKSLSTPVEKPPTPSTPATADSKASGASSKQTANKTLLLGGRKDGHICVFNWDTGNVEFEIEAHGTKGVLSMIANSKADQLISAGLDNVIKVWRLYPYAQESLAPLMSFFCAHTPIHMAVMRNKLVVAFQEHSTATYSVVMYNLQGKKRIDHGPEDDHVDDIRGLTSCPRMKLVASCSHDGTVKIWNDMNNIVRLIKLNAIPHSISFCSHKGDILLGIGNHVHKIDYKKYMPKAYRFKMVSMQFVEQSVEKSLPFDENLLNQLSREDIKRLRTAKSSFKFTRFVDVLTDGETAELAREKKLREKAFSELEARENELLKIRDGELKATRKPKQTPATNKDAFDKYLKMFYHRPKFTLPEDDQYPDDTVKDAMSGAKEEEPEEWQPEIKPVGFFPTPPSPKSRKRPLSPSQPAVPVKGLDGFIPNSVLARLLWPEDGSEKKSKDENYRPPQLSQAQMQQLEEARKKARKNQMVGMAKFVGNCKRVAHRERSLYLDYEDDKISEPEKSKGSGVSSLLQRAQTLMEKTPTPVEEPVEEKPVVKKEPSFKREPSQKPIVKKLIPPVRPASRPVEPPSTVRSLTPSPPPPSPLPDFIDQFRGEPWFEKYFPNCNVNTMPKPWTVSAFVTMLAHVLKVADYTDKTEVVNALLKLEREEGIQNKDSVYKTLYSALADETRPPTCINEEEKDFIVSAIKLLYAMGVHDKDFCTELMVQFLEGDKEVRNLVLETFEYCGVKDPHNHFPKEMDSWDVWNIEEKNRPRELRTLCRAWLDKWMITFKIHLEDSVDRLKKGQGVHGRVTPGMIRKGGTSRTSVVKSGMEKIEESSEGGDTSRGTLTVTFDTAPDITASGKVTPVEAISYFCEMELEKDMQRLKGRGPPDKSEEQKNTVLVLPRLQGKATLVRLGETHTSKCRPARESTFAVDLRLPPITTRGRQMLPGDLEGFPPCINLPMKQVLMNPFPGMADDVLQEPVLLMLKSSQKYFVHSRSYLQDTY